MENLNIIVEKKDRKLFGRLKYEDNLMLIVGSKRNDLIKQYKKCLLDLHDLKETQYTLTLSYEKES